MGSTTTVQAPPARDIGQETSETLASQIALAPEQYAAYQQFAPQYAQTDVNTLGQSLFGGGWSGNLMDINKQLTEQAALQSQQANTAQRTANIADVNTLGGQVDAIRKQYNPEFYAQQQAFGATANAPIQQSAAQQQAAQLASTGYGTFDPTSLYASTNFSPSSVAASNITAQQGNSVLDFLSQKAQGTGQSDILQQQQKIASGLLAQGGNLSPDELRAIQQQSRAAFAARGLDATNASVVDETFQTEAAKRARLLQNMATAQGVESQTQSSNYLQNQLGLGASNQLQDYGMMDLAAQQANQSAGLQAGIANQNASLQAQQLGLQAQQANQNLGLNAFQTNLGAQQAQQQALNQAAAFQEQQRLAALQAQQQALGNYQSSYFDPFQGVLGQSSGNMGLNTNLFGTGQATTAGSNAYTQNMFDPFSAYAADLYNTNYNAQAAANIASANNSSGLFGSTLGAIGTLGGGLLGNTGLFGKKP